MRKLSRETVFKVIYKSLFVKNSYSCDEILEEEPKHRDIIKYTNPSSLLDYLDNPIIFYDDKKAIEKSFELLQEEINDYKNNNDISNNTKFMPLILMIGVNNLKIANEYLRVKWSIQEKNRVFKK